ncbi:MAG: leucine-rich repeat domain-containing protein [Bacteroidetes bacterium]|nr:leucine-rich repeat domain-containing protein [Bacteroidota bacterium]
MNKKLLITAFVLTLTVNSIVFTQSPDEFRIEQLPNGTIRILGFLDTQKKRSDTMVIPNRISGIPVTSIGDDAFYFQLQRSDFPTFPNGLETIILPDTLREIGDNAFSHFTQQRGGKLNGLVIPRSVTKIGDSAFFDATRQSSPQILVLPSSVKEVGVCAFYSWNIGELYIESVFQIIGKPLGYGEEPFSSINSSSLQKITFPANWPDSTLVKLGLPTGFINYYKSQGKKAGTYVRNGQLWLYSGAASSPPDPRSTVRTSEQSQQTQPQQQQQNNQEISKFFGIWLWDGQMKITISDSNNLKLELFFNNSGYQWVYFNYQIDSWTLSTPSKEVADRGYTKGYKLSGKVVSNGGYFPWIGNQINDTPNLFIYIDNNGKSLTFASGDNKYTGWFFTKQ